LEEVFVKVNGKLCYLWRVVDHESEVLEAVVTTPVRKRAPRDGHCAVQRRPSETARTIL
jgi:transposase-like protein